MGREKSLSALPLKETSNTDEIFMHHSTHFTHSLKELKSLREQLYSAAEHFELSFGEDEHKHLAVNSLKDYVSKAVISTVDHLGCVASKLETFLDEKVDQFSATQLRFSSIEQKSRSHQQLIDRSGLMQNSFLVAAPKYQKHYYTNSSVSDTMCDSGKWDEKYTKKCSMYVEEDNMQARQAYVRGSKAKGHRPPLPRRNHKPSTVENSQNPQAFSFTRVASNKEGGKRSHSPLRFILKRSGSNANRSASPSACNQQQNLDQAKTNQQDLQLQSKKTKHMLKALLSIHRSHKGVASRYRDDM